MASAINSQISPPIAMPPQPGGVASPGTEATGGASFKNVLLDSIEQVNSMQLEANQAVESMVSGGDATAAEVLTAVQKADMAFRMMMQIRTKLIQAYDEVKNIRV